MEASNGEVLARLLLSVLLGGMIGFERERRNQPAGFRTHLILCVGSALIMLLSIHVSRMNGGQSDPGRIAAQVVSGVGFLGAGAILRLGVSIKGLTTAASLWTTAGIGMAMGAGYYIPGALATAIMLVALSMLASVEKLFTQGKKAKALFFTAREVPGLIGKVEGLLSGLGMTVQSVNVEKSALGGTVEVHVVIESPTALPIARITDALGSIEEIREIEIM